MNNRLAIDKAGRIVILKPLTEELHLEPSDILEMESAGEEITLRSVRGAGPLVKEHGVWCFMPGKPCPPPRPMKCFRRSAKNGTSQILALTNEGILRYVGAGAGFLW